VLVATLGGHAGRVHRDCTGTHHRSLDSITIVKDSTAPDPILHLAQEVPAEIDTLARIEAIYQS
jgi:hypothetical protein